MELLVKEGEKWITTFRDGTTAKMFVKKIMTFPATGMPPTIIMKYQEGETNKQLVHPVLGEEIPYPIAFIEQLILEKYIYRDETGSRVDKS